MTIDIAPPHRPGHSAAMGCLRGMVALLVVLTAAVNLYAVVMIVWDQSDHDDEWDGFGTFIGSILLAGFVPTFVVCVVVLTLLYRRPRAGIRGAIVLGWLLCLIGLFWLLPVVNGVLGLLITTVGAVMISLGLLAGSHDANR